MQKMLSMWKMLQSSPNKNGVLKGLIAQNPVLQSTINLINNSSGTDMEEKGRNAYYEAARAKGMSDSDIERDINQLRGIFS